MPKNEKERKTPVLRFEGFTDDWIKCKLKDIAEINPSSQLPEKFKYIDLESVVGTSLISYKDEKKSTAPSRAQRLAQNGDLFYQTVRPYQKNNYLFEKSSVDYVFSTGYAQIRPNIDGQFLLNLVQNNNFVNLILRRCTGTSYPAINSKDLAEVQAYIPNKNNEHQKIGLILKILSNIITLEQEKLRKFKKIKSYLNYNLFPKSDNTNPSLNFFEKDTWKKHTLNKFLSIPKKEKVEIKDRSEILTVRLNLNGVVADESRSTLKLGSTNYYRRYEGQFIYGKQNLFNGALGIISKKLNNKVSSADIPSLNIQNINSNFLFLYLSRPIFYKQTEAFASGTGSKRIHENTLLKFNIMVPSSETQTNVSAIYYNLNCLIKKQDQIIKKYMKIKQSLLNTMFI